MTRVQPHWLKKFRYRSWSNTFPIRPYKIHRYNHWIANADTAKMYHVCTGAAAFSYDAQKFYIRGKSIDFVKTILLRSYEENYGSGCTTRWVDNQNTRCRNCFAKIIHFPSVCAIYLCLESCRVTFLGLVTTLLTVVNLLSSSMGLNDCLAVVREICSASVMVVTHDRWNRDNRWFYDLPLTLRSVNFLYKNRWNGKRFRTGCYFSYAGISLRSCVKFHCYRVTNRASCIVPYSLLLDPRSRRISNSRGMGFSFTIVCNNYTLCYLLFAFELPFVKIGFSFSFCSFRTLANERKEKFVLFVKLTD